MKPVDFILEKPDSLGEAINLLRQPGEIKLISGGQSLGPMLNLRLARPKLLVSIADLPELRSIQENSGFVEFGAALRHAEIEDGALPEPVSGMMRHVAAAIAYRAVRNQGTIGGSLCHADPAADWVSAMAVLDATLVAASDGSERNIAMNRFIQGAYRTDLGANEILTRIKLPRYGPQTVWGYYKICRKVGEFADAIATWVADPEKQYSRVVFGATAGAPVMSARLAEEIAQTGTVPVKSAILEELAHIAPDVDQVRHQLLAVALQRCVEQALNHA